MSKDWWCLPGPYSFVEGVLNSLRTGKSAVVCLPDGSPLEIQQVIEAGLDGTFESRVLALKDGDSASSNRPETLLFERYLPGAALDVPRTAGELAQNSDFQGYLVWLINPCEEAWDCWSNFLYQYSDFSRRRSLVERSLFCVILQGEIALRPPDEDVCLSVHRWDDSVEHLDMLQFVTTLLRDKNEKGLQRELVGHIVTELALWDPLLAKALVGKSLEELLNPIELLKQYGTEKQNWGRFLPDAEEVCWSIGVQHRMDRKNRLHSAMAAILGHHRELDHRLWKGQIRTLYPFIEEQRYELIEKCRSALKVPYQSQFALVEDYRDLELAHIEVQLSRAGRGFRKLLPYVRCLKKARNHLSHFEVVPYHLLVKMIQTYT